MASQSFSPSEFAELISKNQSNLEFMRKMMELLQTLVPTGNDAGLASSVNNEAQIASSDESTVEALFQEEEVSAIIKPVDSSAALMAPPKNQPSPTDLVEKKPRAFKPKETLKIARKYYTIEEVAEAFRIGKSTLHKYLKDKKIQGIKIGNQWRFSEEALEAFEKGL